MSPTRIDQPAEAISLDLSSALTFEQGLGRAELLKLGPQMDEARGKWLASARCSAGQPQQLLDEYQSTRHRSTLGQILSAAKRLRDVVDRAAIFAPPALIEAAKVLFAACCHPHHNDLSRGQRGGRPRIFFAGAQPDNDALQGLLDILPHGRQLHTVEERWGLVAVDDAGGCNLLGGLFGVFWEALQTTVDAHTETQLAIAVGPADSPLMQLAGQIECQRIDLDSPPARKLIHPGVLLAASVMGMDVVKLLRGAALMADRLKIAPPGDNPPLDLAGLRQLLAQRRGIKHYLIETPDAALQPLSQWCSDADRSGGDLLIQLIPQALRRDRLRVTMRAEGAAADEKKRITRYLSELATLECQAAREARTAAGRPTAVVQLPLVDESSIGQLIQLFAIAAALQDFLTPDPDS